MQSHRQIPGQKIAIVGCGIAGMSSAILLHDAGHAVSLFERFEQVAPVGSGLLLQPAGLAILERMGLRQQTEKLGQRIDGMVGRTSGTEKLVLDIRYEKLSTNMYGVAIHRASLFHILFVALQQRNLTINTSHDIVKISHPNEQTGYVQIEDSERGLLPDEWDLVIDASGYQSKLLGHAETPPVHRKLDYGALWATVQYNKSNFNPHFLEQRYSKASVMVGVLPCGHLPNGKKDVATLFWSIKSSSYEQVVDAGIEVWKDKVRGHWPVVDSLLDQIPDFAKLTFAHYSHHTLRKPFGQKIIFIGDAAHSTSPQLGQGANHALLDSFALATAFLAGTEKAPGTRLAPDQKQNKTLQDIAIRYAMLRKRHVMLYQLASYTLTPFYQSDNRILPWLRDITFVPVSKMPFSNRLVTSLGAGLLGNPLKGL